MVCYPRNMTKKRKEKKRNPLEEEATASFSSSYEKKKQTRCVKSFRRLTLSLTLKGPMALVQTGNLFSGSQIKDRAIVASMCHLPLGDAAPSLLEHRVISSAVKAPR